MPSLWQVNNCFKVSSVSAIENDSVFGPHFWSFKCKLSLSLVLPQLGKLPSCISKVPPLRLKVTLFPNSICPGIREQKYKLNPVLTHYSQRRARARAQTVKTNEKGLLN